MEGVRISPTALAALMERLETESGGHVLVLRASIHPHCPTSRYVWAGEPYPENVVERLTQSTRVYVAARNLTLHKYIVVYNLRSRQPEVMFRKRPDDRPTLEIGDELAVPQKKPALVAGPPIVHGCGVHLEGSYNLTATIECMFEVKHEGMTLGRDMKELVMGLDAVPR